MRAQNPNIDILEMAIKQLGGLVEEMVFLGGCATGLLITDRAAPPIRVTRDVDTIVQVGSLAEYHQLSDRLRKQGFKEDTSDNAPLCRWVGDNVILDVMPTDQKILGFSNRWYPSAIKQAGSVALPSGNQILLVSAPYFLITKLEAFDGRGKGDYQLSHDIEDIVAVLDGRQEFLEEISCVENDLKLELANRFKQLLEEQRFMDALVGHLPADSASQARLPMVFKRMRDISELE
jgi:predicted nucleotidyltransferase